MAVTIRDVARHAGVSPMTVSRVINGSSQVSASTRAVVEEAVRTLGYVPNVLARGLSAQRTGTLALIVPDVANPFFTMVVRGAESIARQADYRVLLCNTESDLELERGYVEAMLSHRVEGILIAPVSDRSIETICLLEQHAIPTVLVDRSIEGLARDLVQGDSVGDAQRLVRHLIEAGHRRIAMIAGGQEISTSRDRLRGYQLALKEAGIGYDPGLVLNSNYATDGGYQATQRILWREDRPDAIFAINSLVAVGAVRAIREQRLDIPGDIALACFDDIEHAAAICPFLTVMQQPAESYGRIATDRLLARIDDPDREPPRSIILSAELIVRESCGARRRERTNDLR
ncbi:MAG: substrate-binding domain-containing protein [Roseiflexaceae bacterium]